MITCYTEARMLIDIRELRNSGLTILAWVSIAFFMYVAQTGCTNSVEPFLGHQKGIKFFNANEENLQRVAEYFVQNPEIERISVCPGGSWGLDKGEGHCEVVADQGIRLAMQQLGIRFAFRTYSGSIVFDGGAESDGERHWEVSFVYFPFGKADHKDCNPDGPETSIGACEFELADAWFLRYEWHPATERR